MIAAAAAHANGIALLDSGRAGGDSAATPPGSLGASARSSRVAYRPAARAVGRFGLVCLNARVPSQDGATGNARAARVRVGRGSSVSSVNVSSVKDVPFMAVRKRPPKWVWGKEGKKKESGESQFLGSLWRATL